MIVPATSPRRSDAARRRRYAMLLPPSEAGWCTRRTVLLYTLYTYLVHCCCVPRAGGRVTIMRWQARHTLARPVCLRAGGAIAVGVLFILPRPHPDQDRMSR